MATISPDLQLIARDPAVVGGEPVIRGTRVPVRCIVVAWRLEPSLPRILEAYPRVSPEAVIAALAYYALHPDEIEGYITENDADLD